MHMRLRCHVPGTTNMSLINDVVYLEGRAYLTMKAQLITRVYGNFLRMLTVNFVPHKMSYNVAIYLELTWQYPLSEFLSKQTRAAFVKWVQTLFTEAQDWMSIDTTFLQLQEYFTMGCYRNLYDYFSTSLYVSTIISILCVPPTTSFKPPPLFFLNLIPRLALFYFSVCVHNSMWKWKSGEKWKGLEHWPCEWCQVDMRWT